MNQNTGTIYIATNLINEKQYIGQTIRNLDKRVSEHKRHINRVLYSALKKYGIENFKWVSFSCPEEELDWQETFLIKELNTLAPNGYNLDSGGNKQKHHHEITKQKMREKKIGKNHPMWGIKRPEHSIRMSGKENPFFGKGYSRMGDKNYSSKSVLLISPEKKEYKLSCYTPFCEAHNLDASNITKVLKGKYKQYKGWTGFYLKEGNNNV